MFKSGDIVKKYDKLREKWQFGFTTLVKKDESKVMWDDPDYEDYWYFPNDELELATEEEKEVRLVK